MHVTPSAQRPHPPFAGWAAWESREAQVGATSPRGARYARLRRWIRSCQGSGARRGCRERGGRLAPWLLGPGSAPTAATPVPDIGPDSGAWCRISAALVALVPDIGV